MTLKYVLWTWRDTNKGERERKKVATNKKKGYPLSILSKFSSSFVLLFFFTPIPFLYVYWYYWSSYYSRASTKINYLSHLEIDARYTHIIHSKWFLWNMQYYIIQISCVSHNTNLSILSTAFDLERNLIFLVNHFSFSFFLCPEMVWFSFWMSWKT